MQKTLFKIILLTLISSSCNSNLKNKLDENIDTILINNDYFIHRNFYLSKYEKFYEIIKKTKYSDNIINIIKREPIFIEYIITGNFYNEEIIFEAIILFYLRGFLAKLQYNYYASFFDDMGNNVYTPVFYIIFLKISKEPPNKGFPIATCYYWVKNQHKYLKNPDIKSVIDSIDILLKKPNHFSHIGNKKCTIKRQ